MKLNTLHNRNHFLVSLASPSLSKMHALQEEFRNISEATES